MLSNSTGDLLENQSLIHTLVSVTVSASKISEAVKKNTEAKVVLEDQRLVYSDIASFGSTMYYLLERMFLVRSYCKFDNKSLKQYSLFIIQLVR